MIVPKVVSVLAFPETNEWELKEDSLRCAVGEEVVTLQAAGLMEAPPELAPSRFCVQEWRSLVVRGPAPLRVWLRSEPAANLYDDVVRDTFMNQIGRSIIQVQAAGKWLPPMPLEILSTKRPTPLEHLTFYRALVNDLASRATQLPFTVSAPTGIPAGESPRPRPPSPLFVYHFLRQYHDHLITALTALLAEPHRLLTEEEDMVSLAQATEVDADVLLRILTQPEYLVRPTLPPAAMARLRGYAPARVWQRLGRETFDSPENRFVLAFLRHLLHWTEALQTTQWLWQRVSNAIQGALRELSAHFRLTLADPLFDENVDETTHAFSPKVLDRVFTVEFGDVDFTGYPPPLAAIPEWSVEVQETFRQAFKRRGRFGLPDKSTIRDFTEKHPKITTILQALNARLVLHGLGFGFRVFDEIVAFMDNVLASPWRDGFGNSEGEILAASLDAAVCMKVMPKFHGPTGKLAEPLLGVLTWAENPEAPTEDRFESLREQWVEGKLATDFATYRYCQTARKVGRMLQALRSTGFASFA